MNITKENREGQVSVIKVAYSGIFDSISPQINRLPEVQKLLKIPFYRIHVQAAALQHFP